MDRAFRFLILAGILACLAAPAHAYLDPTSGGMFLQVLFGGIAGAAVAIKMYWHRLVGLFRKKEHDEPSA